MNEPATPTTKAGRALLASLTVGTVTAQMHPLELAAARREISRDILAVERQAAAADRDFGSDRPDGCTHHCAEGHATGDEMTMLDIALTAERGRAERLERALVKEHALRDPHRRADGMLDADDCWLCELCEAAIAASTTPEGEG